MTQHRSSNVRQARRLGVELPDPTRVTPEEGWSSLGEDEVFDGFGKSERRIHRDVVTETWSVSIGRRSYGAGLSLNAAMDLSRWLSKASNRRAWKALPPKERRVTGPTAQETLVSALAKVNGGAVQVTA